MGFGCVETGLLVNAVIAMERINVDFHNFIWQLLQVAFSIIFENLNKTIFGISKLAEHLSCLKIFPQKVKKFT